LVFAGSKTGSGDIVVADGAALGVTATGTQVTPGTLTLGSGSGCTLEFNNVNSTTTAPLAAGTLACAGTITININSGTFVLGQSYPLLTWTTGSCPPVALGVLNGFSGNLSCSGNTLYLNVTSIVYVWTGAADGTNFDTAGNWNPNGVPSGCAGDTVQWDGITATNLFLTDNVGAITGGTCAPGLDLVITAKQTNSVNIRSTVPISPGARISGVTIASGAGGFSFGDNTLNALDRLMGNVGGQIHDFVNNAANPAIIYPNVRWRMGGGGTHTLRFQGTGDWYVTNYLVTANVSPTLITKSGPGTMIWTGAKVPNSAGNSIIASPVTINGGTLILRSSDLLGTQDIQNDGTLQYDAGSGATTLSGVISGAGTLRVSSGTLVLGNSSVGGNLDVGGGTLVPGGVGSVSTLNVAGGMSFSSGTILVSLNKALSPSNSLFSVAGAVNRTGGTLKLLNVGPALVPGDTFTIFSQPVTGGAAMVIVPPPGVTLANNLAVDGSVTVSAIAPPPTITHVVSGGNLNLSWPSIWTGLHLQSQTNSATKGLGTNWVTIPGTDAGNTYLAPLNTANATVFYRLTP
jgi:fibronectin-binding autotransporter adhesin